LYKYVSYKIGHSILEHETAGFTQAKYFNDPFEIKAAYPAQTATDSLDEIIVGGVRRWAKQHILDENYAILSLTRSPLNPLMWAHYAEQHRGFVIGFDCSCEALSSPETNSVPVHFGNVIYTATKPTGPFLHKFEKPFRIAEQFEFDFQYYERFQRAFLCKPMCWSYEEEVRVVKCINGVDSGKIFKSGAFKVLSDGDRRDYLVSLPKGTVREVYLGLRNPLIREKEEAHEVQALVPSARFYCCSMGMDGWFLERTEMNDS
jgi:hypothetical protein